MKIRARTVTKLPASFEAADGLGVNKENGVWTLRAAWDDLVHETTIPDPEDRHIWTRNPNTDTYTTIPVQYLIDSLPQGPAGEIEIGTVTELDPGETPTVTNSGTATNAVLDFELPGSATVSVGATTTLPAGSNATVTDVGTVDAVVLDFGIPRGADASFKWLYESNTSMAAPATGGMRFNNAAVASVTAIAVNAQTADSGNPDQSDFIVKWDDSTSTPKAYIEIREEAASSAVFELTGVTDNTTWLQLAVTYVSGDIALTAGDALYFTPHLVGNKGTDGAGTGDVTSNTATSVDGEIALFNSTTGKQIKRATTTGVLKATSGVIAAASAGTDYLAPAAIGVTVQGYDADTAKLDVENQTLTGGVTVTSKALNGGSAVTTGTLTLDMGDRPLQHYTNGGAHTLAPGSVNGSCMVDITNNGSAGAITTSGWTKVVGSFTTTNTHKFRCHASVGNGGSLLIVQALQ